MKDEKLLIGLGRAARQRLGEETDLGEHWDALAAGKLSSKEIEALRASPPFGLEAADALEAFRPLDASWKAAVVDRLEQEIASSGSQAQEQGKVVDFRQRTRRRKSLALAAVIPLAAAAGVTLVLAFGLGQDARRFPPYKLELTGSIESVRGASNESVSTSLPRFAKGTELRLVARPLEALSGAVDARLFFEGPEGIKQARAEVQVDEQGAVRAVARFGREIDLQPGTWTAWLAVGRPGELPASVDLKEMIARLERGEAILVTLLSQRFVIENR